MIKVSELLHWEFPVLVEEKKKTSEKELGKADRKKKISAVDNKISNAENCKMAVN